MIELSNQIIEGVRLEIKEPYELEDYRGIIANRVYAFLANAPLNDFMFSSLDEEGNINGAL